MSAPADLQQLAIHSDAAEPGEASDANDSRREPARNAEAELKAAFSPLLADPDPDIRREAERLAREFALLAGE